MLYASVAKITETTSLMLRPHPWGLGTRLYNCRHLWLLFKEYSAIEKLSIIVYVTNTIPPRLIQCLGREL